MDEVSQSEKIAFSVPKIKQELYVESDACERVLCAIKQLKQEGKIAGRRSIVFLLKQSGYDISEMKVRKICEQLQQEGKIVISKGKGGIRLIEM